MIKTNNAENSSKDILTVSPSPHMHHPFVTTKNIMLIVVMALLPLVFWACYNFGTRAIVIVLISVISCVLCEYLYEKLMRMPVTTGDFSAVVTGILLALNLPIGIPFWMAAVGAAFAIIIVKMLFGGIGKNFVNPALAARVFLMISWVSDMTPSGNISEKFSFFSSGKIDAVANASADAVASATPLTNLKNGVIDKDLKIMDLIIGRHSGVIGEVSALLIIVGLLILLLTRVITWHIPVSYVGTVALITFLFPRGGNDRLDFMLYNILAGGLLLGAVFMATDYTTSPVTKRGRLIFGVGCGLLTVFIRYFGGYAEGVSFAILIMNLLVFYIDKLTKPRKFGGATKI